MVKTINRILNLFKRASQQTAMPFYPTQLSNQSLQGGFNVATTIPLVRACINLYHVYLSTAKLKVFDKKMNEIEDHWIKDLWFKPNQFMSKSEFSLNLCTQVFLNGNAYHYIIDDNITGQVKQLLPSKPNDLVAEAKNNDRSDLLSIMEKGYYYRSYLNRYFLPYQILHFKHMYASIDYLNATSPLQLFYNNFQSSKELISLQLQNASNGLISHALLSGLPTEKAPNYKQMKDAIEAFFKNRNEIILSTGPGWKLDKMTIEKPHDFLNVLYMMSSEQICHIFSVPSTLILRGTAGTGLQAIKEEKRAFISGAITAFLESVANKLNELDMNVRLKFIIPLGMKAADLREVSAISTADTKTEKEILNKEGDLNI